MIGLGTWEARIDTMFYRGTARVKIYDDNGQYGFEVTVPGVDVPDISVVSIEEEAEHISAVVTTSVLPGKEINLDVDIDGDDLFGFVKVPYFGKVKLKDAHRIAE